MPSNLANEDARFLRHVREVGTHQQLLRQRGICWKLYQLQYKDEELGHGRDKSGSRRLIGAGTKFLRSVIQSGAHGKDGGTRAKPV